MFTDRAALKTQYQEVIVQDSHNSDRPLEVELTIPVRSYDIDFAGIVSNIVYIRWLEDLRSKWLDEHFSLNKQV